MRIRVEVTIQRSDDEDTAPAEPPKAVLSALEPYARTAGTWLGRFLALVIWITLIVETLDRVVPK